MPRETTGNKVLCGSALVTTDTTIDWSIKDFSWFVSHTGEQKSPKPYSHHPYDWWLILKTSPAGLSEGRRVRVELLRQLERKSDCQHYMTSGPDETVAIRWRLSILGSTGQEIYFKGSTFEEKNFLAAEVSLSSDSSSSIGIDLPWERFWKLYDDKGVLNPPFLRDDDTLNIRMRFQYAYSDFDASGTVSVPQLPCLIRAQEKWLDLSDLLESKKGSDFILALEGGKEYSVHRNVLQERSEYFAGMLNSNIVEAQSGRCVLVDLDEGTLEVLLKFLYGGLKAVPDDLAESVFIAADKYAFTALKEHCEILLISNLMCGNVRHCMALAEKYSAEKLRSACTKMVEELNAGVPPDYFI